MTTKLIVIDCNQLETGSLPVKHGVSRIGSGAQCQLRVPGLPALLGVLQMVDGEYRFINRSEEVIQLGATAVAIGEHAIWEFEAEIDLKSAGRLRLSVVEPSTEVVSNDVRLSVDQLSVDQPSVDELLRGDVAEEEEDIEEDEEASIAGSLLTIVVCLLLCGGLLFVLLGDEGSKPAPIQDTSFGAIVRSLNDVASGGDSDRIEQWKTDVQQAWYLKGAGKEQESKEIIRRIRAELVSNGNDVESWEPYQRQLLDFCKQEL
jgi:hypothetical protein